MEKQKYGKGQAVILLEAVTSKPMANAVIVSYNDNQKEYRVNYKNDGDITVWSEDVKEDRLTTMSEIGMQNAYKKTDQD